MIASVHVMNVPDISLYQIPFSSMTRRNETLGNTTDLSRIITAVVAEELTVDEHRCEDKASYNTTIKLPDIL
jgi:hypothetical protein